MCLVIMAFVIKWHITMYGYTQHKHYDVCLIFWEPVLANRPTFRVIMSSCPAVLQQASISSICVLWITNSLIMYCGLHYTYSFKMYTNSLTVHYALHLPY